MAASRICAYRHIASGNRTCWCTTAPTKASMAPTRPTWWCATTARACMCRRASSSRHAKSTSRGSRSTTNAARWSLAAGPMMDFRFDSVARVGRKARQPGSTPARSCYAWNEISSSVCFFCLMSFLRLINLFLIWFCWMQRYDKYEDEGGDGVAIYIYLYYSTLSSL